VRQLLPRLKPCFAASRPQDRGQGKVPSKKTRKSTNGESQMDSSIEQQEAVAKGFLQSETAAVVSIGIIAGVILVRRTLKHIYFKKPVGR
jgi:hypothetical protein